MGNTCVEIKYLMAIKRLHINFECAFKYSSTMIKVNYTSMIIVFIFQNFTQEWCKVTQSS